MSRRHKPKKRDRPDDAIAQRDPTVPFGKRLRAQREKRGFTLAAIAEETKIGVRYLEALEQNDFDSLPGGVFNRGFVRAYAKFIGADTEKLVRDYAREEESRGLANPDKDLAVLKATLERQAPTRGGAALFGPGLLRLVVVTGIVAGAAAFAGWGYVRHRAAQGSEISPLGPALAWNLGRAGSEAASGTSSDAAATTLPVEASPPPDTGRHEKPAPALPLPAARQEEPATTREATSDSERPPEPLDEAQGITERPEEAGRANPAPTSRLSISDFGVGERIVNHQLEGRADRFPEGAEVWFWTRVLGGESGQRILHLWFHEGREAGTSELRIGGAHWRTQSRRRLHPGSAGQWTVEARDMHGRTLAVTGFVCESPDAPVGVERSD